MKERGVKPHPTQRLDLVPESPGVYLMKDAEGSVIYVGKAINLRNRLRSYFGPHPKGTRKVLAMIDHVADFDFVLCANELEALVLESSLIKQYQPFYNILLKDDHDYPYFRVTLNEAYPRLLKAYRVGPDAALGAKYYGPYLHGDLNRALATLHRIFPLKTCARVFPRDIGKGRPCLNYYIHRCVGPCLGQVSEQAYRQVIQQVCDFLEGRYQDLFEQLKAEMAQAAQQQDYEAAAVIRDRLQALEQLIAQQQRIVIHSDEALDVLGLVGNHQEICLQKLEVRQSKITGTGTFFLEGTEADIPAALKDFFLQHYQDASRIPDQILIPAWGLGVSQRTDRTPPPLERSAPGSTERSAERSAPGSTEGSAPSEPLAHTQEADGEAPVFDRETLAQWLTQLRGKKVQIHVPQRGEKHQLLLMAQQTAQEALTRRTRLGHRSETQREQALALLQDLAGLSALPQRIEAYDVSNYGEIDQVCAMTVFERGLPLRKAYRTFHLQQQTQRDDYEAMTEALTRRMAHLNDPDFGAPPDLILLDGGKGHVNTIQRQLALTGYRGRILGLVKDRKHRTRGLVLPDGRIVELSQALKSENEPNDGFDLEASQRLTLLRLLTTIQDETHRRAIQASRSRHHKRQMTYRLESIPGIGPQKRKQLLHHFKTIQAIQQAEVAALAAAPGISEKLAQAIYQHFHPEESL